MLRRVLPRLSSARNRALIFVSSKIEIFFQIIFLFRTIGPYIIFKSVCYYFTKAYHEVKSEQLQRKGSKPSRPYLWFLVLKYLLTKRTIPRFDRFCKIRQVISLQCDSRVVTLCCNDSESRSNNGLLPKKSYIQIEPITERTIRIRALKSTPATTDQTFSFMIVDSVTDRKLDAPSFTVVVSRQQRFSQGDSECVFDSSGRESTKSLSCEDVSTISVFTDTIEVRITVESGAIDYYDRVTSELINKDAGSIGWGIETENHSSGYSGDHWVGFERHLPAKSLVFGLGEPAFRFADLKGRAYHQWNTDVGSYNFGTIPMYQNHPWCIVYTPAATNDSNASGATAWAMLTDTQGSRSWIDTGSSVGSDAYVKDTSLRFMHRIRNPTLPDTDGRIEAFSELNYYFVYGGTSDSNGNSNNPIHRVLREYEVLTGSMSLPPMWSLGWHQSRWSYLNRKAVEEVAINYRRREIPGDVIHLDIHYMDGFRSFTWDYENFPNPKEMLARLSRNGRHPSKASDSQQQQVIGTSSSTAPPPTESDSSKDEEYIYGFKSVCNVDPGIKCSVVDNNSNSSALRKLFVRWGGPDEADRNTLFKGPVWPGDCHFPDFTNQETRKWWAMQYELHCNDGVTGFWNDMNEPSVFSPNAPEGTLPNQALHRISNKNGLDEVEHELVHNVYGMLMARSTREGLVHFRPTKRPFVLSRSGLCGVQRFAAVWTGDNQSTWEHLQLCLSMMLNLTMSGQYFTGVDIGGFANNPSKELFIRWVQAGFMFPLARIHTAYLTNDQSPWSYGPEIESIARKFISERYKLLPYIYTAFHFASTESKPIIRPLFFDFAPTAADFNATNTDDSVFPSLITVEDQFMIGDSLMAAPIVVPTARQRTVILPSTTEGWIDYWTDEYFPPSNKTQTITVNSPLDHSPLFVRGGSIIPQYPIREHIDQPIEKLILHVYLFPLQSADSVFESRTCYLYEDSGEGFDYQHNSENGSRFVEMRFTQRNASSGAASVVITTLTKGGYQPGYQRIEWVLHLPMEGQQQQRKQHWKCLVGSELLIVEEQQAHHCIVTTGTGTPTSLDITIEN